MEEAAFKTILNYFKTVLKLFWEKSKLAMQIKLTLCWISDSYFKSCIFADFCG